MNTKPRLSSSSRRVVDAAIRGYQRHLSPRKGFTCAYLVAEGGRSCSAVIRTIVAERGILGGLAPAISQFLACGRAASRLSRSGTDTRGVCCCGGIPIPFRF